jgi:hypothetical protein
MTSTKQQLKLEIQITLGVSTPTTLKWNLMLSKDIEDPQQQ